MIATNKAKCLKCGEVLISHIPDSRMACACGNLTIAGGKEYCERHYKDSTMWEEMMEREDDTKT